MIWLTADNHFCHRNILVHCSRAFTSVEEMDETMVRRWNEVVGQDDEVWHLGDFSLGRSEVVAKFLARLNGRVHLIWGNHDSEQVRRMPQWASSQPYAEIKVDNTYLVLFHYAMRTWNRIGRGAIHLYGHSHNKLPGDSQSLDVGVDAWDFRPVSLAQIKRRLAKSVPRVPLDHHEAQTLAPDRTGIHILRGA
jgi:calcineurin-like phosphoesterase family protein